MDLGQVIGPVAAAFVAGGLALLGSRHTSRKVDRVSAQVQTPETEAPAGELLAGVAGTLAGVRDTVEGLAQAFDDHQAEDARSFADTGRRLAELEAGLLERRAERRRAVDLPQEEGRPYTYPDRPGRR